MAIVFRAQEKINERANTGTLTSFGSAAICLFDIGQHPQNKFLQMFPKAVLNI